MFKIIFRWIRGYILIELSVVHAERFINVCRHRGIYMWRIYRCEDRIYCNISVKDYKKLNDICLKTKTCPHIIKKTGLPFVIHNVFSRKTLVPCFVISCITVFMLSNFLWNIEISGQKKHTKEELIVFLNEETDIHNMTVLKDLDCNMIEKAIRNRYDDISWVSAELKGCNLYIKLTEADTMESESKESLDYSDIVASSGGRIVSIITRQGTPLVKPGERVKKGQVLVKGIVEYTDDSGETYRKEPVYADADIIIETTKKYNDSFAMIHEEKQYTGRHKKRYSIVIDDKIYFLENILNKLESYKKYDIINNQTDVKTIRYFFDKLYINNITESEYETVYKTYTDDEAKELAAKNVSQYMKSLTDKGIVINDKNISVRIHKGICSAYGYLSLCVPQKKRRSLSEEEWSVKDFNEQKRISD